MKPIDLINADAVDAAIRIHRKLGPGLLESVYEMLLGASLEKQGYRIARQHPDAVHHDGMHFANAFRVDLLVDDRRVVEINSVEQLSKAHAEQVLAYLRLLEQPVGPLVNFSCVTMKEGIKHLVNDYRP